MGDLGSVAALGAGIAAALGSSVAAALGSSIAAALGPSVAAALGASVAAILRLSSSPVAIGVDWMKMTAEHAHRQASIVRRSATRAIANRNRHVNDDVAYSALHFEARG